MSTLRPYPLDLNHNAYINQLGKSVNSQTLHGSKGINIKKTSDGIHISAETMARKDNLTWLGFYDFNAEYFPNDVIVINPNQSYVDQNNSPLTLTPGNTYVCINHVPPSSNNSSSFADAVVSYGGTVSSDLANSYRWYQYNQYYPPATTTTFSQSIILYSGYTIVASQSFWQPIGGVGGGMTFVGLRNTTSSYTPNQIVLIQPWDIVSISGSLDSASLASGFTASAASQSSMPGYYLNLIAAAPFIPPSGSFTGSKSFLTGSTVYNIPTQPFVSSGSQYWQMLTPYPTTKYFCTDVSTATDFYTAKQWDTNVTNSVSVIVAKSPRQRPSVNGENIDGTIISYSSYTGSNFRQATDGISTELQSVFPHFATASYTAGSASILNNNMCIVEAVVPFYGTGVTSSLNKRVYLEEISPARVWAKNFSQ